MNPKFIKQKTTQDNAKTMPKTEHVEPIIVDFSEDKIINDYLSAQSKKTRSTYTTYMRRVQEYTEHKWRTILL
jgi:hypothetical protein